MKRRRYHRERHSHYCLLVNPEASSYDQALVQKLARRIRNAGARYTILEPDSPIQMLATARKAAGIGKVRGGFPTSVHQRGKVTALVACGGDGTFNLVGRAAVQAGMPIGLLPSVRSLAPHAGNSLMVFVNAMPTTPFRAALRA